MSETPWLTPRRVARLAETEDVELSPDGAWLASVIRTAAGRTYRRDVWLSAVDRPAAPTRLSQGRGSAVGARWSPTGKRLAWIRDAPQGVRIEIHDRSSRTTTAATRSLHQVDELAWSPDGRSLAFTGRLAGPPGRAPSVEVIGEVAYKRDGEGVILGRSALHVVELGTGAIRTIREAPGDIEAPRWSPDGRMLAVRTRAPGGYRSTIDVIDATAAGPHNPLTTAGTARSRFRHAAWSADSATLLLVGDPELSFHPGLWLLEVRSRTLRELAADPGCEVVDDPVWIEPDRAVVHGRERATSGLYEVDVRSGALVRIASLESRLWRLSADRVGRRFAQVHESATEPPAPVVFDRAVAGWRDTGARPGRVRTELRSPERLTVRSDRFDIDYWLLHPPRLPPAGTAPAIFIVHGGPHHDVGDDWDGGLRQVLASNGFIVAWANPRGSTSYGRRFVDSVIGDFGGGEFRDLIAVVDAVSARDDVDETRLGIGGHSHGAFMTAWAIAHTTRFGAAVAMSGVFDLVSEWGMSDEGMTWGEVLLGGSPGERPDLYRERSPSTHAWRTRTPTLIVHGGRDERCPVGQSELMFRSLRSAGCEAELVLYPEAGHDLWTSPVVVEDLTARMLDWFGRRLRVAGRDG